MCESAYTDKQFALKLAVERHPQEPLTTLFKKAEHILKWLRETK